MAALQDPPARRSRTRSPSYPYLALPDALEKAAALWQAEGRHPATVGVVMGHWGYKEDSSTGFSCVAALKKFGLVDHEGMGEARQVRLSALVLAILLDADPESPERRDALRRAALAPRIHAELWETYGAELPSDQSLKRFLVLERAFNESSVDELLAEYKATMAFAGLNVGTGAAGTAASAARTPLPFAGGGRALATNIEATPAVGPDAPRGPLDAPPRLPARPNAPPVPKALGSAANGSAGEPAPKAQRNLFGEEEEAGLYPAAPEAAELALPPVPAARPAPRPPAAPLDPPTPRELPVPLDNDRVARVPYPMSEEDFSLLLDTLQLWKKRLVQPGL